MISFACPKCGKKHTARDKSAGRRGFCECGAVMLVPETGIADPDQTPKLIGQIDLHSEERHFRYLVIGESVLGVVIVALVAYLLLFRNAWERDNGFRLLALKSEGDTFVQRKEYEKAKTKYAELFTLLGDRDVRDEELKGNIESARIASLENNMKVEPILAARAESERKKQLDGSSVTAQDSFVAAGQNVFFNASRVPPYKANAISTHLTRDAAIRAISEQYDESPAWIEEHMGTSNDLAAIHHNLGVAKAHAAGSGGGVRTGAGHVNYSLVQTFKSSWQREGWSYKTLEEQKKVVNLIHDIIATDIADPEDREATWQYFQQSFESW